MKCKNCEKFEEMLKKSFQQTKESQDLVRQYEKLLKETHEKYINLLKEHLSGFPTLK